VTERPVRDRGAARHEVETRAMESFEARFRERPVVVASAPGRVNLMGDHTDYAGGPVLPMAIDARTAVALRPSDGAVCEIESLEFGACLTTGAIADFESRAHDAADSWLNLAVGPLRLLSERAIGGAPLALPNLRAVIASSVPIGAGLSSSAALSTAMTTAVLRLVDRAVEQWPLIDLLRDAEARFAGTPCGIMDMTVALAAEPNSALLIDCGRRTIEPVPLPTELALLLVDSGVRHALGDGGYAARRAELAASAHDPRFAPRARHVASESARVHRAAAALRAGHLAELGALAFESHASLRHDFEVSVPECDRIVDFVRDQGDAHGTFGARMTGGGFGGSVLVFAARAQLNEARAFLHDGVRAGIGVAIREVCAGERYTAGLERGPT